MIATGLITLSVRYHVHRWHQWRKENQVVEVIVPDTKSKSKRPKESINSNKNNKKLSCELHDKMNWFTLIYNAEKAIQKRFVILVLDADTIRFYTFTKYITFLKLCIHKKHIFICIAGKG